MVQASSYITMGNINKTKIQNVDHDASLDVDRPIYLADLNNSKQERRGARFDSLPSTHGN